MRLSERQSALLREIPHRDGLRCRGARLRTARALVRRGLAREQPGRRFVKAFPLNVAFYPIRIVEP